MKKLLFGALTLVLLLAVSCKENADKAKDATEEKTEQTAEDTSASTTEQTEDSASSDVPSFSDSAVQDYVNSYEEYMTEYKKIAESKDMTAFAGLGTKGQELAKKAQEVLGNLSGDDAKKLTEYMTAKSKEIAELTKALTQQ